MKLSEIAEYIADNYPESNIAYNNDVIKGSREEWYEESLIDPLLDFYMHEELGLCGCGNPEFTYETIRRYLSIIRKLLIDTKMIFCLIIITTFNMAYYNSWCIFLMTKISQHMGVVLVDAG